MEPRPRRYAQATQEGFAENKPTIELDPGESVTCTFENHAGGDGPA